MKKNLSKLTLSKETVRNLEKPEVQKAAGGTRNCSGNYNCITYLCATSGGMVCAHDCIEP